MMNGKFINCLNVRLEGEESSMRSDRSLIDYAHLFQIHARMRIVLRAIYICQFDMAAAGPTLRVIMARICVTRWRIREKDRREQREGMGEDAGGQV